MPNRRIVWLALLAILTVQFAGQWFFFPGSEVLTKTSLAHIDSLYHVYQISLGANLCESWQASGYDPFFGAGYQGGAPFNSSAKLQTLIGCVSGIEPTVAYKLTSFLMGIAAPALIFVACIRARLPLATSIFAALVSASLWWASPIRWYHTAGMVSFVFVTFASIAYGAELAAKITVLSWKRLLGFALVGALLGLTHPHFAFCMPPVALALILCNEEAIRRPWKAISVLAITGCLVILASLLWILPTISSPGLADADHQFQRFVDWKIPFLEMFGLAPTARGGSKFYLILVLGSLVAPMVSTGRLKRIAIALTITSIFFLMFASLAGTFQSLALLQPNRLTTMGWLTLTIPFAICCTQIIGKLRSPLRFHLPVVVASIVMAAGLGYQIHQLATEFSSRPFGRFGVVAPEVKGISAMTEEIVKHIRQIPAHQRVLFEASTGRAHDGAHIGGYLALTTRKEILTGPYLGELFASAADGVAFREELLTVSKERLRSFLEFYNVGLSICYTPACKSALSGISKTLPTVLKTIEGRSIEISRQFPPSMQTAFISGSGRIDSVTWNQIIISEAVPGSDGKLALRYHWTPGLVTVPATKLQPRYIDGISSPFIEIVNPPASFAITSR